MKKAAIITGIGGSGIGRSIALTLARDGMAIVGCHRRDDDGASETVARIVDTGGAAIAVQADALSEAGCNDLVSCAMSTFGGVYACVINAGAEWSQADPYTLESRRAIEDVTDEISTLMHLMPLVLPSMREQGSGRFVGITDGEKLPIDADSAAYAYLIAKGARRCAMQIAAELTYSDGITFNIVSPGGTGYIEPYASIAQAVEALNYGDSSDFCDSPRPQDVAEAVSFLCSERARYVMGSALSLRTRNAVPGQQGGPPDACDAGDL